MITNQVLLLLMLSMLWPSTALPLMPGNIGKLFGMPESDGRILQRSKRGWMWNQFFLLEEYTGNDHQYVGKVTCPKAVCRLIVGGLACWMSEAEDKWAARKLTGSDTKQVQMKQSVLTGFHFFTTLAVHLCLSLSSTDVLLDRCHYCNHLIVKQKHGAGFTPPQKKLT